MVIDFFFSEGFFFYRILEGLIDILFFLFIFILEADIASRFRPKYKIMKMENEFFFFFFPL